MRISKLATQAYAKQVINGSRTLHRENVTEDLLLVPKIYQDAVIQWIKEWCKDNGYDDNVCEEILAR